MKLSPSNISALEKIKEGNELEKALKDCQRQELLSLYTPKNIALASEHIETLLEEHSDDDVLRLLWAHAQISKDILPLSFIASSVYEVLLKNEILEKAPRLTFLVVAPLALQLGTHKEYRIGLLILGHILSSHTPHFFMTEEERHAFFELIDWFIQEEKTLAIERKEAKNYFDFIASVSDNLAKALTKNNLNISGSNISISDTDSHPLDQHSAPTYKPGMSEDYTLGEPTEAFKKSELPPLPDGTVTHTAHSSSLKAYFYPLSFFILVFALFYNRESIAAFTSSLFPAKIPLEERLLLSLNQNKTNAPRINPLPPFYSLSISANSSLEKINERLKNISSGSGETSRSDSTPPVSGTYSELEDLEPLNNIPENGGVIPEGNIPEAKPIPTFKGTPSASSIHSQSTENLGGTEKVQDISGKAPPPSLPPHTRNQQAQNQGTPARQSNSSEPNELPNRPQYPVLNENDVEKFNPPLVFETISATNVLSAPTFFSPSIVRLQAQSLIEVTARIGVWLEIRSNAGQTGYILAQDAKQSDRPNRRLQ